MVTENDRRWPVGLHGTPGRFGKLIEYHLFDAPFFSVHGKQASVSCCTASHNCQWHALGEQASPFMNTPLQQPGLAHSDVPYAVWRGACINKAIRAHLISHGVGAMAAAVHACDGLCTASLCCATRALIGILAWLAENGPPDAEAAGGDP